MLPGTRRLRARFRRRGHAGLVAEQVARPADVGDVVRHLAEQRRRDRHLRLNAELAADQLGAADERCSRAVGEIDRLVYDAPLGERSRSRARRPPRNRPRT